ncbi:MAG: GTP-binding protein [[Clostridium] nexile]
MLAHVDAGKTTLAESILYVSGKTRTLDGSWECIFRYL